MDGERLRWRAIFEDRYGDGSYERLTTLFRQPCVTFADIARQFGVSRERVRQWQVLILPSAPSGHQRQGLCGLYRHKRRLLADPLFRSFYQHVRSHVNAGRIELIRTRDGYRSRCVRIDGRTLAIKEAGAPVITEGSTAGPTYSLARYRGSAEFVYVRLTENDYLFLPQAELLVGGTTFADFPGSRYASYKNTFDALPGEARRQTA